MTIFDFNIKKGFYSFEFKALSTENHAHPVVEIIFSKEGTFTLESNGLANHNLSFAIIEPNIPHKFFAQNCTVKILMIESYNQILKDFLEAKGIFTQNGLYLKEKYAQKNSLSSQIKELAASQDLKTPTDSRVSKSITLIENNDVDYKDLISFLTSKVHLSDSRLTHLFKKHIGISIKKYLVWHKLRQAMALYLEGKSTLTEVSFESGFFDQAHLTNSFKIIFGVSPSKAYNSRTLQS